MEPGENRSLKSILLLCVIALAGGLVFAHPLRAELAQMTQIPASVQLKTVSFSVEGMSCGSCVASVKRAVKALDGVTMVDVSLADRRARVQYIEGKVTPDSIAAAVRQLGYKAGEPAGETGP